MDVDGSRAPTLTRQVSTLTREAPAGTRQAPAGTRQAPAGARQAPAETREALAGAGLPVLAAEGLVKTRRPALPSALNQGPL
ncbi:MAG: hypothetical protein ACRDP5_13305 [Streptosporangiaceae bacterium]